MYLVDFIEGTQFSNKLSSNHKLLTWLCFSEKHLDTKYCAQTIRKLSVLLIANEHGKLIVTQCSNNQQLYDTINYNFISKGKYVVIIVGLTQMVLSGRKTKFNISPTFLLPRIYVYLWAGGKDFHIILLTTT